MEERKLETLAGLVRRDLYLRVSCADRRCRAAGIFDPRELLNHYGRDRNLRDLKFSCAWCKSAKTYVAPAAIEALEMTPVKRRRPKPQPVATLPPR
jgi:hypothetical protein